MFTSPSFPMSGRLRPVTLLSVNPVPFCFANDRVWLLSGAAGFSVQARPSTSGIARAAKRRFMGHCPFVVSGGHKARRPPGAAAVVSVLLHARSTTQEDGRLDPPPSDGPRLPTSRPTAPLQRIHPHLHAQDSSRGDCAPLLSSSSGPSRQAAAAAGCSGRVAYSSPSGVEERTSACTCNVGRPNARLYRPDG